MTERAGLLWALNLVFVGVQLMLFFETGLAMKLHSIAESNSSVLLDRLSAIRSVQDQLELLSTSAVTPTSMMSQIHLYEILLSQISGIRSNLASGLEEMRKPGH